MRTFQEYITEEANHKSIHFFDLDDTLFHHPKDGTGVKVHVQNQHGKRVKTLSSGEYNSYKLPAGHKHDYSEFASSHIFADTAKPIKKTLKKLHSIVGKGGKAEILTARSDMDDKDHFSRHLGKHGIDTSKVHVRRSGNLGGTAPENKKNVVHELINKHGYKDVHLYDDHHPNLEHFLSLKKDHPSVTFNAHHVDHDPKSGKTKITTTKV